MHLRIRTLATTATAALVVVLAAAPVAAQDGQGDATPPGVPGQPGIPDSVQAMIQEYQELQNRLGTLQEQAIEQNDELREERDQIQETVEGAMREVSPGIDEDLQRMEEIQTEINEAQEAQDREALMSLSAEAQQLRTELQDAQAQALENPDVQEEIEAFQESLVDEMSDIDPETEALVARLDTLTLRLQEIQQSAPAGPPGG